MGRWGASQNAGVLVVLVKFICCKGYDTDKNLLFIIPLKTKVKFRLTWTRVCCPYVQAPFGPSIYTQYE